MRLACVYNTHRWMGTLFGIDGSAANLSKQAAAVRCMKKIGPLAVNLVKKSALRNTTSAVL